METFNVASNSLHGPIPPAVGATIQLTALIVLMNSLCAPIPAVFGYIAERGLSMSITTAHVVLIHRLLNPNRELLIFVEISKSGSAQLLRAMSGWQSGPATHLWIVSAMARASCLSGDGC